MPEIDAHRAQIFRQQCSRIFRGKSIHDIVGALQMLTANMLTMQLGEMEETAISGARAIAGDIENIIRERFAGHGKGH